MRRGWIVLVALAAVMALRADARPPKPTHERVVIDTDAGDDIDDAYALALALRSPEIDLVGVTTAFGDTTLRAHLVMRLLADAGRRDVPVAAGVPTKPMATFSQATYAKDDTHPLSGEDGVSLMLRLARQHPGEVTLLAIGPLTNVGAAIDRDLVGFHMFKRVVIMAGSIEHGYVDDHKPNNPPSSEWNVRLDPVGLRKLLASGVPVTMLPLDATQIPLPKPTQVMIASQDDPLSRALTELTREATRPVILFDVLTTACVVDAKLCPSKPMHLGVDDEGFTRPEPGAPNVAVCLKADEPAFLALLQRRLRER
jgi:purine nucleosidase